MGHDPVKTIPKPVEAKFNASLKALSQARDIQVRLDRVTTPYTDRLHELHIELRRGMLEAEDLLTAENVHSYD